MAGLACGRGPESDSDRGGREGYGREPVPDVGSAFGAGESGSEGNCASILAGGSEALSGFLLSPPWLSPSFSFELSPSSACACGIAAAAGASSEG